MSLESSPFNIYTHLRGATIPLGQFLRYRSNTKQITLNRQNANNMCTMCYKSGKRHICNVMCKTCCSIAKLRNMRVKNVDFVYSAVSASITFELGVWVMVKSRLLFGTNWDFCPAIWTRRLVRPYPLGPRSQPDCLIGQSSPEACTSCQIKTKASFV